MTITHLNYELNVQDNSDVKNKVLDIIKKFNFNT